MTLMKHATVWSFEINLRRPGPSVASSFRMIYNITQFNLRCSVIGSGRVMLFRPKTDNWRVWKRVSERAASSHLGHSTNCAKSRIHHDERKKTPKSTHKPIWYIIKVNVSFITVAHKSVANPGSLKCDSLASFTQKKHTAPRLKEE